MWLVLVLMLLLEGTAVPAIPQGPRNRFKGIDCHRPARVRYGLVKNVCKAPPVGEKPTSEEVLILQESKTRVVEAYLCTVHTTKVTGLCAVWSHLKLQEPLAVNLGKPFSECACYKVVKDGVFVTESKHTPY